MGDKVRLPRFFCIVMQTTNFLKRRSLGVAEARKVSNMNNKDVMCCVGNFIEKYGALPVQKVEWPQLGFEIKLVSNVEINEEPLEKFKEGHKDRWTFKGTANIGKTDERATVTTKSSYEIIGSAKFSSYKNPIDGCLLPDVEEVTITKATPVE